MAFEKRLFCQYHTHLTETWDKSADLRTQATVPDRFNCKWPTLSTEDSAVELA